MLLKFGQFLARKMAILVGLQKTGTAFRFFNLRSMINDFRFVLAWQAVYYQ